MNVTLIIAVAVVVATAACIFGLGWEARGCLASRQADAREAAGRAARVAPCDRPVPYPLTVARVIESGQQLAGPPFAGTSAPGQPFDLMTAMARANRLSLLSDAMGIVERQYDWRQAEREVAAIIAEVEADPERWRHR